MARPKRPKTTYIQTNPKIDELNRLFGTDLFSKQKKDYAELQPKIDKWLKDNKETLDKLSDKQKHNFGLKIDDNGFVVPCELPKDSEFYPRYKEVSIIEFSYLTDTQLQALLPLLNENFFVEALTASELKEVFESKRTAKVKNLGAFSYLLNQLSKQGFLADNWQHQADQGKMFVSVNRTPIKAKKLSKNLDLFKSQAKSYVDMYSQDDIPRTYKAKMRLKEKIDILIGEL